jgi:hypothetical protein
VFKATALASIDSARAEFEPNYTAALDCRTRPNTTYNAVGIAFAVIVSWGGEYSDLGIRPNFNCLYLYDSAALKALMLPVGHEPKRCEHPIDPTNIDATHLSVRATTRPGLTLPDYPPVARWASDPRSGAMFISLVCGAAWCEVGRKDKLAGFASTQYVSTSPDPAERRVMEVRGWYDEQPLAVIVNGKPVPSHAVATMVPHRDLDSYTEESFVTGHWLPAVHIVVRGALSKYQQKLNLEASTDLANANEGFLCKGISKDCIPQGRLREVAQCANETQPRMFGKIVSVLGKTRYFCVNRSFHQVKKKIPGTVRWAWFDDDEGGWWRCPNSCCYPG